jgi:hypothetical protein
MEQFGLERTYASRVCLVVLCFGAALVSRPSIGADRIILRNLDILSNRTVAGFDEDGVRLDDQSTLGWDEIEAARVRPELQANFDRHLEALGSHLYRIRQRLRVGDYRDVLSHAEALYSRYRDRQSPAAYMVVQSLMWGRLAVGQRASALEPYLLCYSMLQRQPEVAKQLPGDRRLKFDAATGLTPELPPIWFDRAAVEKTLETVFGVIARMPRPRPPGAYIYYATLALTANQPQQAERVMKAVPERAGALTELRLIISAQKETVAAQPGLATTRLANEWANFSPANQPLALYWIGRAGIASIDEETRQGGLLLLMRIPATYGEQHPVLAGAALYQAMETLSDMEDSRGSVAIRNELLVRYGQTWHASRTRTTEAE